MTHVRICIDNKVMFDGDLEEWKATPPDAFKEMLTPGAKPEQWMKAIMIVMADAALTGQSVSIEAITGPSFWSMEVTKTWPLVDAAPAVGS